MHGQFHFCRREPSFYPALPFPPASPPPPSLPPAMPALPSPHFLPFYLPPCRSGLRGNFFDKLFSAFFAGGCKLNPPWRPEEACISQLPPGCDRQPPRGLQLTGPPAITADTKPIRAGYRLHYHFTFFVRSPGSWESPGSGRSLSASARSFVRVRVHEILRASAHEGVAAGKRARFPVEILRTRMENDARRPCGATRLSSHAE